MKWDVFGKIVGSKYIGQVEADTEAEAIEKGAEHNNAYVSFCHQCANHCEDPELVEISVDKAED